MSPRSGRHVLWLAALLVACGGKEEADPTPEPEPEPAVDSATDTDTPPDTDPSTTTDTAPPESGPLTVSSWDDQTDADGILQVEVDVDAGTTAFMVTGKSNWFVSLERVLNPQGQTVLQWEDWWDSDESLTNAFFGFDKTTAFNWPIREADGPLEPGTWTVELSTLDNRGYYEGNTNIEIFVHTKRDDDLSTADVRVVVLYADGVDQDADVVSAVEAAVARWSDLWEDLGLTLDASYQPTALDPQLDFTYTGSPDIEALASGLDEGTLVLVVGEQVENEDYTYGIAGGIPGTLAPSPMSFVVVAWLTHAGIDAAFDAEEIRIMGETMAHEMGHYIGLFHPVESSYRSWDALEDTPACNTWQTCEQALGRNNMFPYPICNGQSCLPQDRLSPDQQAVVQRYTGAL